MDDFGVAITAPNLLKTISQAAFAKMSFYPSPFWSISRLKCVENRKIVIPTGARKTAFRNSVPTYFLLRRLEIRN